MNTANLADYQKNVSLNWDEMKIKSGLDISKGTGKLVGFCDYDNFNEELHKLELASHILVFMVRGMNIYSMHTAFPSFGTPARDFSWEDLWDLVWRATHILEDLGLKVQAWVCDGPSPNCKFYWIQAAIGGAYYYINRYATHRKIFFICDVPYLVKTV